MISAGSNIKIDRVATATSTGMVSIGNGINVDGNGEISVAPQVEEDFTSKVTFTDNYANAEFVRVGNMVWFFFQGSAKTHTAGETTFTIPAGYRPKKGSGTDNQVWFTGLYAGGDGIYATTFYIVPTTGVASPNITDGHTLRLYISGSYYIA